MKLLVQNGRVDLNEIDREQRVICTYNLQNPVHFTVYRGHSEMLSYLLNHGADPTKTGSDGINPLHLASLNGFESCVRILLSDPRVDPNTRSHNNLDALLYATFRSNTSVVRLLVGDRRLNAVSKNIAMRLCRENELYDIISESKND